MGGETGSGRPYRRLTGKEKARFLRVLEETGNRKAAAAAIGVEPRLMDQRRKRDPEFDQAWKAAVERAHRGLADASGPFDCPRTGALNMIRRGKNGRLQRVSVGEDRWSAAVEARFMAALRTLGSVRGAAHAVGFSEGTIWERRRKWPAFAERLEQLLDEAELELQFRLAAMGTNIVSPEGGRGDGPDCGIAPVASPPFDADFAMRFLKWREEKRRGGRRGAPRAKPPTIEEVTEKIIRRVEAIRRHRGRGAAE